MKDYQAGYSNIGWASKGLRALLLYAIEKKFMVGVSARGVVLKPECLVAAGKMGQVQPVCIQFDMLETIMPEALTRYGNAGVPIVFDFLMDIIADARKVAKETRPNIHDVPYLVPTFEQWELFMEGVVLHGPDGEPLDTAIPEDLDPAIEYFDG